MKMGFIQTMVQDKARQRVITDIALIESEWPAHTPAGITSISGFCSVAGTGSGALLLSVPSSTWFKPRMFIVDNQSAAMNQIWFYEGGSQSACSGIMFPMQIDGKSTVFLGIDCITTGRDLWVQAITVGNLYVKVGGILLPSAAE